MSSQIISQLERIISKDRVLTSEQDLQYYGKDWTRFSQPAPLVIVLPTTTEEVQAVINLANEMHFKVVPSGGRTGLSGAAMATQHEVVVALDKMNRLLEINPTDQTLTCEAGRITAQIQQDALDAGLFYPVDFASSGTSQIGGNIATNAGGIKVIRYGLTRNWIAGLKVVTGHGDILELNKGLTKNATGYDLRQLFIGAEGTLGVVTEVTLKLIPPPANLTVMVLGVNSLENIMEVLKVFQKNLILTAFEFFSELALNKVLTHHELGRPFEQKTPYYVLIEYEQKTQEIESQAMHCFEECLEKGFIDDGTISQSQQQFEKLWAMRERISETIATDIPYKNDLSVLPSKIPQFLKEVDQVVADKYPDFEVVWFGHIGDGNIHLNILKPESLTLEDFIASCEIVNETIFTLVSNYGGSVSAEHGIGLLKKPYLKFSKSAAEIALMKSIRSIFDPNLVLNPGKLWD